MIENKELLKEIHDKSMIEYKDYLSQNLKLNMARGKPGTEQLELSKNLIKEIKEEDFFDDNGEDLRNYGMWSGLDSTKKLFSSMMDVPYNQIVIGNNSSLSLMFDVISKGFTHGFGGNTPWCKLDKVKFLCPVPGYDRHFSVTEHFGVEMIPVPMDLNGPDMDIVEELAKNDESIKGIWCVPKYANPTGITYSDEVVTRFAKLETAAKDFKIMWDNAYCVHDLSDTPDTLLSIYDECLKNGTEDRVFIFASTSKITYAGAGIAAFACSENVLKDMAKHFMNKTIGPNKINELMHSIYLKDFNGIKNLMNEHKKLLVPKFNMVVETLEKELSDTGFAVWNKPNGGYFVSVDVKEGCAKRVVELCKNAGVVLTGAGATYPYGNDPKDSNIRIAPTFPPVAELETAMKLFCVCVKLAVSEKYL